MNPDGSPSLAGPERLVYFSSVSENTHRFVQKLGVPAIRIPPLHERIEVHRPYVLLLPTYGRGRGDSPTLDAKGYVPPKQVIRFLNNPHNRSHIRAVVGGRQHTIRCRVLLCGQAGFAQVQGAAALPLRNDGNRRGRGSRSCGINEILEGRGHVPPTVTAAEPVTTSGHALPGGRPTTTRSTRC